MTASGEGVMGWMTWRDSALPEKGMERSEQCMWELPDLASWLIRARSWGKIIKMGSYFSFLPKWRKEVKEMGEEGERRYVKELKLTLHIFVFFLGEKGGRNTQGS